MGRKHPNELRTVSGVNKPNFRGLSKLIPPPFYNLILFDIGEEPVEPGSPGNSLSVGGVLPGDSVSTSGVTHISVPGPLNPARTSRVSTGTMDTYVVLTPTAAREFLPRRSLPGDTSGAESWAIPE